MGQAEGYGHAGMLADQTETSIAMMPACLSTYNIYIKLIKKTTRQLNNNDKLTWLNTSWSTARNNTKEAA